MNGSSSSSDAFSATNAASVSNRRRHWRATATFTTSTGRSSATADRPINDSNTCSATYCSSMTLSSAMTIQRWWWWYHPLSNLSIHMPPMSSFSSFIRKFLCNNHFAHAIDIPVAVEIFLHQSSAICNRINRLHRLTQLSNNKYTIRQLNWIKYFVALA